MTKFEKAFYDGLKGFKFESAGFSYTCPDCLDAHDICGSSLGGTRYAAHAVDGNDDIVHFEACTDCIMYMANGELPEEWS